MQLKDASRYAPIVVRIGLSLVFLWFGMNQLLYPLNWIGWVPMSMAHMMGAHNLVFFNGIFEVVLGVLLLVGKYTRVVSLLLALHLLGITFSVGFNEIGVRDFGLTLALVSVFLHGSDDWCFDRRT